MLRPTLASLLCAAALTACGDVQPDPMLDGEETDDVVNPSASVEQGLTMPACGTALASFDGTTAYSNGSSTGTGISCGGVGSYGYRYQCVELVMRHFKTKWGLRWYGNAKDLLTNAPRASVDVYANGDAAHPPVPGDMIVWKNGTYGHVALVSAVRSGAIDIIEQNVAGSGRATLSWNGAFIGARWTTWTPAGWAHAKANTTSAPPPPPPPPPPTGITWTCSDSAYNGAQYWTCSGADIYRCTNGVPQRGSCAYGCIARAVGTDDLCIDAASGWSCSASEYHGQWWTCSGGKIYRCQGGTPVVVSCPSGCTVGPLGTNDRCN